jgi:Protein of unknown function (DUF2924)
MRPPTRINALARPKASSVEKQRDGDFGGTSAETAAAARTAKASKALPHASAASVGALAGQEVSARLAELTALGVPALRREYRRLFRREPPRFSRDQMARAIAYRIQEVAFGGLPIAVERRLAKLTDTFESRGRIVAPPTPKVKLGARLVREWRGRTHVAAVVDGGFEYEGKTFPSLTAIAVEITGAHWSGPRFFGLVRRRRAKKVGASEDETDGESDEVQLSMSGCSPAAGRPRDDAWGFGLLPRVSDGAEERVDA